MGSTGKPGAASGLKDSDFYNNTASYNNGSGVWFDTCDSGNRIYHNTTAYNAQMGIMYEIANDDGNSSYIYDNYTFGNSIRGIYVSGSNHILVAHNLSAFNSEGITVMGRTGNTNPNYNNVVGNLSIWNTNKQEILPSSLLNNTSDYNLFESATNPVFSIGWGTNYTGLSAWQAGSGLDLDSWEEVVSAPSSIQDSINKQAAYVDWSSVLADAAQYTVQGSNINGIIIGGVAPGPYETSGITIVDDADTAKISYTGTWEHLSRSGTFDGTISDSSTTNDDVEYTFTGTTVQFYTQKGPSAGIFDIYMDGVYQTSFDSYSASHEYQVLAYENTSLSNGEHTIKMEVTGTHNASSTGYFCHIDRIVTSKPTVGVVDDADTANISYTGTWEHLSRTGPSDGTISDSSTTNDDVEYTFTGTTVQFYTQKGPSGGIFDIYIDNVLQTSYDSYSASHEYQVLAYENTSLSNGEHTVKIVVTGTKNASSTGYFCHIDYVETSTPNLAVIDDADTINISYTGTWDHQTSTGPYDGTISVSNTANDYLEYTFTGDTVEYYTQKGPSAGIFDIYLDGVLQTSFDSYSSSHEYQVLAYENTSLTYGTHTLKIVVTGTKNASSTNYYCHIDRVVSR
jgi:hypothetical protein